MQTQSKEFNFNGQNVYVGFDVHLKSWTVSTMIENVMLKTFSQPACPKTLYNYLTTNFPGGIYHSAYEAGFCGFWVHYELLKLGINSIVVNPADIPTTGKEKDLKTDLRDSKKIARSLRNGDLVPIYVPSEQVILDRTLVRTRRTLVKDISRNKHRIKSFLYCHGIEIPEQFLKNKSHWSKPFMKWLKELDGVRINQFSLNILIKQVDELRSHLLLANRQIRDLLQEERYRKQTKLMLSVTGVGLITAATWLTELENVSRFKRLDDLCGYIGLIPSTHDSGEKESRKYITGRGHDILRKMIIESAWVAVRVDPILCKCFNDYCKRMESNKAILRIAKKLINRIRHVLKTETEYQRSVVK